MPTTREIIQGVREDCGLPSFQALGNALICNALYKELQELFNRLTLTDTNYQLDRTTVVTSPGTSEYLMPYNFGRAEVVETFSDNDPRFLRREIEIVEMQDFDLYWSGYQGVGQPSPEVCAFVGLLNDTQRKLILAPPPQSVFQIRVWFDLGYQTPPVLDAKPGLLENFHHLLQANTSMACIAHATKDPAIDKTVFMNLRDMLSWRQKKYEATFQEYIYQSFHESSGPRRAFNSSRRGYNDDW